MIPLSSATLVLSVVKGIVVAGRQIDQLLTIQAVAEADLAGILPAEYSEPTADDFQKWLDMLRAAPVLKELERVLGNEAKQVRDLKRVLELKAPFNGTKPGEVLRMVTIYLPDEHIGKVWDLQGSFVEKMQELRPDLVAGRDWKMGAAFMIRGGEVFQDQKLLKRCSLIVLDQLFEIGAANSDRIVSTPAGQKIIKSVLQNLADENLQDKEDASAVFVLKVALAATLGAAVDARGDLKGKSEWLNVLLEGMAGVKKEVGEGDNWKSFIGSLFEGKDQGKAYARLAGALLEAGSDELTGDLDPQFKGFAKAVLGNFATAFKTDSKGESATLLTLEWSSLLQGFVGAAGTHAAEMFKIDDPLTKKLVEQVIGGLSKGWSGGGWSTPLGAPLLESILVSIGSDEELLKGGIHEAWLRELIGSVTSQIQAKGLRNLFTDKQVPEFVGSLVRSSLNTVIASPELREKLLADKSGPWLALWVESITGALAEDGLRGLFTAEGFKEFSSGLVQSTLAAIAANPELVIGKDKPDAWLKAMVGELAGTLGKAAATGNFSKDALSGLGAKVLEQFLASPRLASLLGEDGSVIAVQVVGQVLAGVRSGASKQGAGEFAAGLVHTALALLEAKPELAGGKYPELVGAVAGVLAGTDFSKWSVEQNSALLTKLVEIALTNSAVLGKIPPIPAIVLKGVADAVSKHQAGELPSSAALVDELAEVALKALAARGKTKLAAFLAATHDDPARAGEALATEFNQFTADALAEVIAGLGSGINTGDIPRILGALFLEWAAGTLDKNAVVARAKELLQPQLG